MDSIDMREIAIRGEVEYLGDGGISGWLIVDPELDPISVELQLDGVTIARTGAGDIREDVIDLLESDDDAPLDVRGWRIILPPSVYLATDPTLGIVFRQEDTSLTVWETTGPELEAGHDLFVDAITLREVTGWARDRVGGYSRLQVALDDGHQIVSLDTADRYLPAVKAAGYDDGRFGFTLSVPLSLRFKGNRKLRIGILDGEAFLPVEDIHILRGDVKALFITTSNLILNPMCYYRSNILAQKLWRCGVETVVMEDTAIAADSFSGFDFVLLQGCTISDTIRSGIDIARRTGALIIADAHGMDFEKLDVFSEDLPDSGNDRRKSLNAYRLLDSCDVVTVSDPVVEQQLSEAGYRTVQMPLVVDDQFIKLTAKASDPSAWNILVISDDLNADAQAEAFKAAVFRFMSEHPDVTVTVIGEFGYFNPYRYGNISVYQRLDHAARMFILSKTDVVLLPRPDSHDVGLDPIIKFVEAASHGVPVVSNPSETIGGLIESSGVGFIVDTEHGWYDHLSNLYDTRQEHARYHRTLVDFACDTYAVSYGDNTFIDTLVEQHDRFVSRRSTLETV